MPKKLKDLPTTVVSSPSLEVPPSLPRPKKVKEKTTIRIHNNLRQMISLNIRDAQGVTQGIEIPAYGDVTWPNVAELGPDVMVKTRQKYLTIH